MFLSRYFLLVDLPLPALVLGCAAIQHGLSQRTSEISVESLRGAVQMRGVVATRGGMALKDQV